ncbi:GWxTD domain-containing protein [Rubrivirga sp.]|uniref:GWxTD domain-containing protein n=1 Tax=Rubrivirga sp. TaxID=1885344 RepID=UPI003B51BB8D
MPRLLRVAVVVALALAAAATSAQDQIVFRPDVATFRYTDEQSLVELYLSFRAETLPFAADGETFQATVPAHVVVRPVAQAAPGAAEVTPVVDQTLSFAYALADTAALASTQVFVEQVRLAVAPGEYELDVTLEPEGQREVRALLNLTVPDYAASAGTAISAVQLATSIQPTTDPGPLSKSGLTVRPNPDAFYGGVGATVRYYAEVYGPPAETDTYTLLAFVAESADGQAMADHETRLTRRARPVDVVAGELDVSTLPSGIYHLRLVALNEANEAVAEQTKRFFVINPDVERALSAADLMSYEETLFGAMGEEELALNVRHARVLATSREQAEISSIQTDDDRRRFLTAFWTARDTDGLPGVNRARQAFYDRLRLVESRFNEFGQETYETDRGRVYLRYGPPTEIDRRPFESNLLQHEVWGYDNIPGEGRAVFVFVDRYSSDRYELIHSDVTGEVSLPNWQTEIQR